MYRKDFMENLKLTMTHSGFFHLTSHGQNEGGEDNAQNPNSDTNVLPTPPLGYVPWNSKFVELHVFSEISGFQGLDVNHRAGVRGYVVTDVFENWGLLLLHREGHFDRNIVRLLSSHLFSE